MSSKPLGTLSTLLLSATAAACAGEVNGVVADGGVLESCLAQLRNANGSCGSVDVNVVEPEDDVEEPISDDAGADLPSDTEPTTTPSCELSSNLIQNPSFNGDLSAWQPLDGNTVVTQAHFDGSADVPSDAGSLLLSLRLSSADPGQATLRVVSGTTQCLPIAPNTSYEVSAAIQLASALSTSTQAGFSVFFYAATDCAGEHLEAWNSAGIAPGKEWSAVASQFVAPPAAMSARLRLNTSRLVADPGGEILYDRVSLRSTSCTGTPPEPEPDLTTPEPSSEPEVPLDSGIEPEPAAETSLLPEPEPAPPEPTPIEPETPPEPAPPEGPSYAASVEPIFVSRCLESCHSPGGLGGPGLEGGAGPYPGISLNLVEGEGYAQLTNGVLSAQATALLLVGATVEESYLWHKLQNTHLSVGGTGLVMPFGAESLSAEELESVRAWIEGGALP